MPETAGSTEPHIYDVFHVFSHIFTPRKPFTASLWHIRTASITALELGTTTQHSEGDVTTALPRHGSRSDNQTATK